MQENQPNATADAAPTEPFPSAPSPASPPVMTAQGVAPASGASAPAAGAPPAPVAISAAQVVRKPRGTRLLNLALGAALVLAIAGVAFAVGRFTAPPTATAGNFGNGGQGGQFFRNGQGGEGGQGGAGQFGGQGGRGAFLAGGGVTISGTVQSVTATTLTLKTDNGQTIQIALDGSTTYHAQSDASASDVTAGGKVLVRLDLRGGFGGNGPQSTAGTGGGTPTGPTAGDVTVVP